MSLSWKQALLRGAWAFFLLWGYEPAWKNKNGSFHEAVLEAGRLERKKVLDYVIISVYQTCQNKRY